MKIRASDGTTEMITSLQTVHMADPEEMLAERLAVFSDPCS
jgi:hypothetical protein